jgi:hypothetical protein
MNKKSKGEIFMSKVVIVSFIVEEDQLLKETEMNDFKDAFNGELGVMKEHGVYYDDWVITNQKTTDRIMRWLRGEIGKLR